MDVGPESLHAVEPTVGRDRATAYSVGNGRPAYLGRHCVDVERCIALVSDEPRGRFGQASLMHTPRSAAFLVFGDARVLDE